MHSLLNYLTLGSRPMRAHGTSGESDTFVYCENRITEKYLCVYLHKNRSHPMWCGRLSPRSIPTFRCTRTLRLIATAFVEFIFISVRSDGAHAVPQRKLVISILSQSEKLPLRVLLLFFSPSFRFVCVCVWRFVVGDVDVSLSFDAKEVERKRAHAIWSSAKPVWSFNP